MWPTIIEQLSQLQGLILDNKSKNTDKEEVKCKKNVVVHKEAYEIKLSGSDLATRKPIMLQVLNLEHCTIGAKSAASLSAALASMSSLQSLALGGGQHRCRGYCV